MVMSRFGDQLVDPAPDGPTTSRFGDPLVAPSAGGKAAQAARGVASGISQGLMAPALAASRILAYPLRQAGAPISADPLRSTLGSLGIAQPQATPAGQAGERIGTYIGAAALPIGATAGAVARGAQLPLRAIAGAESLSALGGAVGEETGRAIAGPTGGAIGGIVGSMGAPSAAMGMRGLARGPSPAAMRRTIDRAADIGVELSPSQALPGAPQRNVAAAAETTFGTIPGGRQVADIRGMAQQAQMGRALERAAGTEETLEGGGMLIQHGLREFTERFKRRAGELYQRVDDAIAPDLEIPLTETRRTMRQLTETKENIQPLLATLQNERISRIAEEIGGIGQLSYEELRMVRSAVGRQLENPSLVDNLPRSEMKRLYRSLSTDMENAVQGPARQQLRNANRYYRKGIERVETFLDPAVRNAEPGRVLRNLITGGKVGSQRIRAIRDSLQPAQWRRVQSAVLRDIGKSTGSGLGEYSHERFLTNYRNLQQNSPEAVNALFGKYGQFRRDVDQLAEVADRIREGSRVLYNPSGTGARTVSGVGGGMALMAGLTGNTEELQALVGTGAASALLEYAFTRPAVTHWLARATQIPVGQMPGHVSRLESILDRERERDLTL